MDDPFRTLLYGPRTCPECGAQNLRSSTWCHGCGQRLINRNPVVRFVVTVLAVAIVAGVIWWKLKR